MNIAERYFFKDVTLLITHYNRSSSLECLLKTCKELGYTFEDIVVSDDGSHTEHLDRLTALQTQYSFSLITSERNKGLGNNINKGQDAVKTPLTLYVQEDFAPLPAFGKHFRNALEMMQENPEMDFIRFYAYIKYPHLLYFHEGYSRMIYKPWSLNYLKIYLYSDHPHLRRSSFLDEFGRYKEGISGDKTEYRMCISAIQKGAKGLLFNDYKALFDQRNSEAEPSTMKRHSWTQSGNILIKLIRDIYRQLKYNYDILFMNTTEQAKPVK